MKTFVTSCAVVLTLGGCASSAPPPPPPVDAFSGILNMSSAAVPADAPVSLGQPVGFIISENVEHHIGFMKDTVAYWGKVIPSSLTNTAAIADSDPNYFSAHMLAMLKRHFPTLQYVHDFPEAVATGKKGVILIDMRMKWMEPYGDRTNRIHVDAYFFDRGMNPVSKLSGEAEYKVPFASMEGGVQRITDAAIQQIDAKITALVR
ncbi:hypothetical protein PQH03_15880 [Ralstonia insidiosa]|jgi:hypothetical protein|nr:hypothetical protein [Ralstonia insidiosa]MBX3773332.1 hypothetical protein [Ralstonia pickettii]NOZ15068.1 hypothetical protein [Betaproteobacteria bacterium]MBC9966269.1 hypothetical protein [Ralstonia insidiosa]MBX3811950.1 hypothetical protein [Ralstonia pickettii]MBX3817803.1 hypothetical protein [Ralstonia insidiosa]